jgi:predicted AlkP superfamily pyrophosphatase or phosphodiesterase
VTPVPSPPEPVLPDFAGPCLTNVIGAVCAGASGGDVPDWVPPGVAVADAVVLVVIDGLGWEQLQARRALAPVLTGAPGGPITSVAPSTTACALTSLTTGRPPAVHGVVGYRVAVGGRVLNVLGWRFDDEDARRLVAPTSFQPFPAFGACSDGPPHVPVVSRFDYAATGFSAAHLGESVLHAVYTPSGLALEVGRLVHAGERFVYAYYDGIDRVAHARGIGAHYDAELRFVDEMVAQVLEAVPAGTAVVVTADHGQVDVGPVGEVLGSEIMDAVTLLSGEGRFRWLHTRPGAADDVAAAATDLYGDVAWVRTRDEVIAQGWLGGEPVPAVADRMGDVVLVPFEATAFLDPADTGEQRLLARHGSLTSAEMLVPLLALIAT